MYFTNLELWKMTRAKIKTVERINKFSKTSNCSIE